MDTPAPSIGDRPRQVRITADGTTGTLHIDGVDFSNLVYAYALQQQAGQPPQLILHAHPHKQGAEFDGLAHVVVGEEPEPGQAIADFLSSIDPKALEQAALNREDLGDDRYGLARAMLAQAADWAQSKGI